MEKKERNEFVKGLKKAAFASALALSATTALTGCEKEPTKEQNIIQELPDFEKMSEQEVIKYVKALYINAHNNNIDEKEKAGGETRYNMDDVTFHYSPKTGEVTLNFKGAKEVTKEYISFEDTAVEDMEEKVENAEKFNEETGLGDPAFPSCAAMLDIYFRTGKVPEEMMEAFIKEYKITEGPMKEIMGDVLKEIGEDVADRDDR